MNKNKKTKSTILKKKKQKRAERSKEKMAMKQTASITNHILYCIAPSKEQLKDSGIGTVLVVTNSGLTSSRVFVFLIDSYCLGIKRVDNFRISSSNLSQMIEEIGCNEDSQEVSVSYAKKLVEEAISWASTIGFEPTSDVTKALKVFKGSSSGECNELFEFGRDGKPFYISGPNDSLNFSNWVCKKLHESCGTGGYDYALISA
jgi:hypothetical protein